MLTPFTHFYPYSIKISSKGFDGLKEYINKRYNFDEVYILLDENIREFCYPFLIGSCPAFSEAKIIQISSGENFKSIESCKIIWDELTQNQASRNSVLINLGGGVICDLGGFAASTFKRGIDFINIPTTLLSIVDASGGGKLGLDYQHLKNQVGLFNNPQAIFINPNFLRTLPKIELLSGFAEVIKHALVADKAYWEAIESTSVAQIKWIEVIKKSIEIKSKIVHKDPNEKNERKKLNFGHTIGHALESYSLTINTRMALLHGEAVAIGIIIESYLSYKKTGLSHQELDKITSYIKSLFKLVVFPKKSFNNLYKFMLNDKKNTKGEVNFTLLNSIGKSKIGISCKKEEIKDAFEYYSNIVV